MSLTKKIIITGIVIFLLLISIPAYVFIKNVQNDLPLREYVVETLIPRMKTDIKRFVTFSDDEKLNLPVLFLEIGDKEYQELDSMRLKRLNELKESKVRLVGQNKWGEVKAKITYDGKDHKIKIRIRGDMPSNYNRGLEHASYRIDIDDDTYLFGKKKLSLVRPFLENNFYSFLFSRFFEEEKYISTDIQYVNVNFNGQYVGVYMLQEGFSKELVESTDYREGVIVRFNNDCYDNNGTKNNTGFPQLDAYSEKRTIKDTSLSRIYARALFKMDLLKYKKIGAAQCFNIPKYAKYLALCDLFLAHHSCACHNLKLYFNPINDKYEPVAWDPSSFMRTGIKLPVHKGYNNLLGEIFNSTDYPIYPYLFSDTTFIKEFNKYLYQYSSDTSIIAFVQKTQEVIQTLDPILYRQRFQPEFSDLILKNNIKKQHNNFTTNTRLSARLFSEDGILIVKNDIPLTIKLTKLKLDSTTTIQLDRIILPYQFDTILIDKSKISPGDKKFMLYSTIYGVKVKQKYKGKIFKKMDNVNSILVKETIDKSILNIDEKTKVITFKKNPAIIENDLFIPSNYTLKIASGTIIELKKNSDIMCESTVIADGKKGQEIKISSDGTGGIVIKNTLQKSVLNYVIFDNLSNPDDYNWTTTGAVTFYESNVDINNCIFKNNIGSDDMINIIRSRFTINNSLFSQVNSDAVDLDFSIGSITDTKVENTGNDALDFSGSKVEVSNCNLLNIGDKGISSGEKSIVNAKNITIQNAFIGIASKDNSKVVADNISITKAKYSATVYQKKPEYGEFSQLELSNFKGSTQNMLIQKESFVVLNNKTINGHKTEVYKFLYDGK